MLRLLHPLLRIDQREAEFTRRGFTCARPAIRERLERVGHVFLQGYHSALQQIPQDELAAQLDQIDPEQRGFAYEGAAMALVLQNGINPWSRLERFSNFLQGAGQRHIYMLYVGAGWACARLPWLRMRIESVIDRFHPVMGWLAVDGYGFHEGYFHWQTGIQPRLLRLSEDARHIFYQGLGRSLWFVRGADASAIKKTISSFAPQFHADAWSGVGLGCAYAGGMDGAELEELHRNAGNHRNALGQGAAFAAKARQLAGNPTSHTDLACEVLCGMNTEEASTLCDETLAEAGSAGLCAYQKWRGLIRGKMQYLVFST